MNSSVDTSGTNPGSAVERTAAAWLVRREEGPLSASEAQAFDRWLAANPANRQALVRMERLWNKLGPVEPAPRPASRTWPRVTAIALAATVLLTLAIGSILTGTTESRYSTDRELRTITLEDGTRVTLDANTRLSTSLSATRRTVELFAGKARFAVSHDPSRPFTVHAGPLRARALGTVFDVAYNNAEGVSVAVLEGSVEVVAAAPGKEPESHLGSPGDTVTWQRHSQTKVSSGSNLQLLSNWAEGRLVFRGEAASTALEQVNRYERAPLRLPPAVAPDTPVYGAFRAGDGAAFLTALAANADH